MKFKGIVDWFAARWTKRETKKTETRKADVAVMAPPRVEPKEEKAQTKAKKPGHGGPNHTMPYGVRKWHRKHQRMARRTNRKAA